MNIISIQTLLNRLLIGKIISKQIGIPETVWGFKIISVTPCDLNYGCDSGFLIRTDAPSGCNSFTVYSEQEIGFDN